MDADSIDLQPGIAVYIRVIGVWMPGTLLSTEPHTISAKHIYRVEITTGERYARARDYIRTEEEHASWLMVQ